MFWGNYETRGATQGLASKKSYKTNFYGRHSIKNNSTLAWNYFQSKLKHMKLIDLKYQSCKKEITDLILSSYTSN